MRPSFPLLGGHPREAYGLTQGIGHHELLLVDTDITFRDELSVALQRLGISIVWRARVLGLLEAIAETRPLAVVLSGDLPGGEPAQLLRSIRAQLKWSHLPVYVVGSALSRAEVLQAYVEGADSVLTRSRAVPEIAARALGRARVLDREGAAGEARREGAGASIADAALDLCATGVRAPTGVVADLSRVGEARTAGGVAPEDVAAEAQPGEAFAPGAPDPERPASDSAAPATMYPTTTAASSPAQAGNVPPAAVPIGVSPPMGGRAPVQAALPSSAIIRAATPVVVPDVIIVEDDPSLLEMLRYALTNRGYQTLSFSNGLDALRAMREMDTAGRHPVVLLDVDLPGIDGFRILHELSGSRPGDFRVILCTVHNSEATQVLGLQSGALDYLVKPLRMPIVLAKVERLVGPGSFTSAAQA